MDDDLVKRLRNTPNWMREGFQDWKDNVRTYDRTPFEAAARIEALEAQVRAADALADLCAGFGADEGSPIGRALAAYRATKEGGAP